jgi:hypothetical protein
MPLQVMLSVTLHSEGLDHRGLSGLSRRVSETVQVQQNV